MARLLLVNHALGFGGSPISMLELAIGLRERGHEVITAGGGDGPMRERYEAHGFEVHVLPRRGPASLGLVLDFYRLVRRERIEVIHLNTLTSYFKYPAWAGRLAGVPVVWWSREDTSAKRCQRLVPSIRRLASHLVTVSKEQTLHLQGVLAAERMHVFYKGIHPERSKTELAHDDFPSDPAWQRPLVGYMGALETRKGFHDLVDAIARLRDRGIEPTVLVVGNDPSASQAYLQQVQQQIERLSLDAQFVFLGSLMNARRLYHHVDLFVLPTHWDCCARVLLEAMEARCPIVTTDAGGTPEMLVDGESALLVPAGDPERLGDAIGRALADPGAARERAELAHRIFLDRFLFEYHLDEVDTLYRRIAAGRGRPQS